MLSKLLLPLKLCGALYLGFISNLPGGLGFVLRRRYYRRRFNRCGSGLTVGLGVVIENPHLISVGNDVHIDHHCIISSALALPGKVSSRPNPAFRSQPGELLIGSQVHLVHNCILMAHGGIQLGDRCTLSAGTKIYSLSNLSRDPEHPGVPTSIMPYDNAPFLSSPVVLEDNVWVGLDCIIMPGACIGQDSFVVSQALVLGTFPANSKLKGAPAVKIGPRFPQDAPVS